MKPYEGNDPYIFISYAHKNTPTVIPIIEALDSHGYRIWYDAGIEAATKYNDVIARHIEKSTAIIAFVSSEFDQSENCKNELAFAFNEKRPVYVIYLDNAPLSSGLKLQLVQYQAYDYHRNPSKPSLLSEISKAQIMQGCLARTKNKTPIPPPTPTPTPPPEPTPTPTPTPSTISQEPFSLKDFLEDCSEEIGIGICVVSMIHLLITLFSVGYRHATPYISWGGLVVSVSFMIYAFYTCEDIGGQCSALAVSIFIGTAFPFMYTATSVANIVIFTVLAGLIIALPTYLLSENMIIDTATCPIILTIVYFLIVIALRVILPEWIWDWTTWTIQG